MDEWRGSNLKHKFYFVSALNHCASARRCLGMLLSSWTNHHPPLLGWPGTDQPLSPAQHSYHACSTGAETFSLATSLLTSREHRQMSLLEIYSQHEPKFTQCKDHFHLEFKWSLPHNFSTTLSPFSRSSSIIYSQLLHRFCTASAQLLSAGAQSKHTNNKHPLLGYSYVNKTHKAKWPTFLKPKFSLYWVLDQCNCNNQS